MQSKRKRIGLLGGSFDPPHLGHLTLAQDAYEGLRLDEVWFIPTFLSPHKSNFHVTPEQRVKMVTKMISGDQRFRCCDLEVKTGQSQFSVDTVDLLQQLHPTVDFFWLIGADQLPTFHMWKDVERLASISQIVVFRRPGFDQLIPEKLQKISIFEVEIHEMMISSSEIRDRIAAELPVYMFLHPEVNVHIEQNHLYRN